MSFEAICECIAGITGILGLYGVFSTLGISLWYMASIVLSITAGYFALVAHMAGLTERMAKNN